MDLKTTESILYSLWYQITENKGEFKVTYEKEAENFNVPAYVIHFVIQQANNKKSFYYQTWPKAQTMLKEASSGRMTFDEFFLSKVAFQAGYTEVYVNEFGHQPDIATPGKWITDDIVVSDFAEDNGFKISESRKGHKFILEGDGLENFQNTYGTEIKKASRMLVDELLEEKLNTVGGLN